MGVDTSSGMIERLVRSIRDERSMRLQREVEEKRFRHRTETSERRVFSLGQHFT
ncbi:hypothetical protein [Pseudomonas sp. OIL-1]|uniref:hypothetical protein n=1 Tax=Pseudomonas sp. OIL-1 TaxID=2706126 RepID=UPI0013A783D3|nr:hypothetical protein [Pseudomonas sp. OIL-1]QIB50323.1 hypothetical protein G3M63_04090 [Pseudomonas sp. OIL-1]